MPANSRRLVVTLNDGAQRDIMCDSWTYIAGQGLVINTDLGLRYTQETIAVADIAEFFAT